ncbi:NAD(P)-binding protein [Lentinus tigrinus ALCF2SS1-6]|uniref:NAD(P)-binding protein n=1 Tax=Lentinus tigrinus ALCF2SS1-6 TaxID=1328759 RepID=A0A5C2S9P8_9APHY|nr:NAD(P)-binding protein [Lentinus tigrinus ALCF2SS1-6]
MHNALLHPKAWCPPKKSKDFHVRDIPDLTGKVALVTGGTYDVGFEIAKALASAKARVIILSPKQERAADALEHIRQHCRDKGEHPHPDVDAFECDLASLQDVKRAGDQICQREERLDIVVCTAGLGLEHFQLSEDKIDKQFAVTYLAHFLLLNRLLPLLRRTASSPTSPSTLPPQPDGKPRSPPRVILQASTLHTAASPTVHFLTYAELSPESIESSSPVALYARAQLATLLFAKRLARLLSFSRIPIRALAADPGPVHPERPHQFQKAYGPVMGTAAKAIMAPFERTPEQACLSLLWAATAPEVEEHWERWQGAYVSAPGVRGAESSMAKDEEREEMLWSMSEKLVRQMLGNDALHPWTAA